MTSCIVTSQKAVEAHGCKPLVTNLLIVPHVLGILTANVPYRIIYLEDVSESQMNAHIV